MSNYKFHITKSQEKVWDIEELVNFCIKPHSRNFKSSAKLLGINIENEGRFIGVKRFQELIMKSGKFSKKKLPEDIAPFIIKDSWQILEHSYTNNKMENLFWSPIVLGYNIWANILEKNELPVLELDLEVFTNHPDINFDFHKIGREYKERCLLIRLIHDIYQEINEIAPDNEGELNPIRKWFEENDKDYFDIDRNLADQLIIGYAKGKVKKSREKDDFTISTTFKVLIHPGWFKDKSLPDITNNLYDSYAH